MYQSGFAISTIRLVSLNYLIVKIAEVRASVGHSDQRCLATTDVVGSGFGDGEWWLVRGQKRTQRNRADCSERRLGAVRQGRDFFGNNRSLKPIRAQRL
jgi:hypothetical protein